MSTASIKEGDIVIVTVVSKRGPEKAIVKEVSAAGKYITVVLENTKLKIREYCLRAKRITTLADCILEAEIIDKRIIMKGAIGEAAKAFYKAKKELTSIYSEWEDKQCLVISDEVPEERYFDAKNCDKETFQNLGQEMINSINKARNIDYSYSKESYALQTDMTEKVDQKYIDDYIERAKKVVTAIDEYTKTLNRAIDAINTLRAFMLQNSKERTIAMNLKDGFMAYPIFNTACTVVIALAAAYISFFNI